MDMFYCPLKGDDGRVVGVVGIGRDMTERKQAEVKITESEDGIAYLQRT